MLDSVSLSFHLADNSLCMICNFGRQDLQDLVAIEAQLSSSPWTLQNFEGSVNSSHVCVGVKCSGKNLTQDSPWIAYAVFSLVADEAELLLLGVDKHYQGRGIAKALLQNMETLLMDYADEMFLEVRASNEVAIGLYDGLGFNCVGERRNYYPSSNGSGGREDALIYGKNISGKLCL